MATETLTGNLDPFIDPASGLQVAGAISGTITYEGNPGAGPQLQTAVRRAIADVLRQKLAAGQVAVPTIAPSISYFAQDIAIASNAGAFGVQITGLTLAFTPAAPPADAPVMPQQLPPDPMTSMKNAMAKRAADAVDPSKVEVRGQMNIGGFKVRASSKGGLDTDGLLNQAKSKAKTEITWFIGGCVILIIVLGGLCGLGGYIYWQFKKGSSTPSASEAQASTWDGSTPFTCGGNDSVHIENVTASLPQDTAISAGGNCHVQLVNVNLTARVGVSAGANATIEVTGGSVTGSEAAAQALGGAHITFQGTTVTGEKSVLGGATITGP